MAGQPPGVPPAHLNVRNRLRQMATSLPLTAGEPEAAPLERPEDRLSDRQKRWLKPLGPGMAAMAWGLDRLNRAIMRRLFGLRVKGREHLPDRGPVVFTPNHVSCLDPSAVAAALDYHRLRETYWASATAVVFHDPLLYLVCRLAQVVPIDREHRAASALAFGAAVLKRGKNLVWFPEGQWSPDGELLPFKPGIGMLLAHYPVKVVPVFIQGTREAMPPGKLLPRWAPITVVFGEPLDPRDLERQGRGDEPRDRIADALHDHVSKLGRVTTSA